MSPGEDPAAELRPAAFAPLEGLTVERRALLPYALIPAGLEFRGERIPLIQPRGIFIPGFVRRAGLLEIPLSFNTAPPKKGRPKNEEDVWGPNGLLRYAYVE